MGDDHAELPRAGGGEPDEPGGRGPTLDEVLAERFPDLTRTKRPPSLGSINGVGTTLYGRRDYDPETHSYVATHYFVLVFIPLVALGAYRVVDAPGGGFYCLGRVPLSNLARSWNKLLLSLLVLVGLGIGWAVYTSSPEYQAGQLLAEARAAEEAGDVEAAVGRYGRLVGGPRRTEARAALRRLLDAALEEPGPDLADRLRALADTRVAEELFAADVSERVIDAALGDLDGAPRRARDLLAVVEPFAPDRVAACREQVLAALVAAHPDDVDAVDELAGLLEARGERERLGPLLEPVADELGGRDGARILGQLRADAGDLEGAHALLVPYVEARLEQLHRLEARQEAAISAAIDRAAQRWERSNLHRLQGVRDFSELPEAIQEEFWTYAQGQVPEDPDVVQVRAELAEVGPVVDTALELGVVKLQLAQELPDPGARQAELEAAEEVFLAVQGVAADDPNYKLGYGQVLYWLGRREEGHALFEELRVLAPQRAQPHHLLLEALRFERDRGDHERFLAALEGVELDLERYGSDVLGAYYAEPTKADLASRRESLAALEGRVEAARAAGPGPTLALALLQLADARLGGYYYGQAVDADGAVALAEEAWSLHPSASARWVLVHTLLHRALEGVARERPALQGMREATRRSLGAADVVIAALAGGEEPLRAAHAADADVQRAAALEAKLLEVDPLQVSVRDWALLEGVGAEAAADAAAAVREDEVGRLRRIAAFRLAPLDAGGALALWLQRLLDGDPEGGRAFLAEAAEKGIPLPF